MSPTARQVHWGEAALYFGLDLAGPMLALMIDPALVGERLREVARRSILANRSAFQSTGMPLDLRGSIVAGLGHGSSAEAVDRFVESTLVSHARPQPSSFDPLLKVYEDETINERFEEATRRLGEAENLRAALDALADGAAYDAALEAVGAVDSQVASGTISAWDEAILLRNADTLNPADPLANLVATFDFVQKTRAIGRMEQKDGADGLARRRDVMARLLEG